MEPKENMKVMKTIDSDGEPCEKKRKEISCWASACRSRRRNAQEENKPLSCQWRWSWQWRRWRWRWWQWRWWQWRWSWQWRLRRLALPTTFAAAPSSEHRQADVLAVHDSSRVVIASVRFYKAFSGEELFLPRQVCTKVRKESEAEWYFQWIAELVQRPQGFFRFVVTDVGGDSHVLEWKLRICERSHTPMTNLTKEDDGTVWIAVVEKDAPRDYADFKGLCVCDFGGCCKFCGDDVPSRCCGTNGCCRAGNCGHECCEKTRSADAAPSES